MIGPLPVDSQQAVVLLVSAIFLGLGALLAGSVGLRWWAALKRVPGAYREGRETTPDDRDE